ncbi:MAG: 50S ribosomal protein L22 [Bacilli bacterium]|jgi:large subunit ribosomal protein L22|nr:50S ribosomal protein L22 [Bacilli bacterium]MDD4065877.1 50S ribosomal protein L22 [Bacilli bacterium]
MEAKATVKTVRITPRKVRLVIDEVRGKSVDEALALLANTNTSASPVVAKLIKSASANASKNHEMDATKLYVKEIFANDGIRMRRFMTRAKGSASGLVKRTCHITCIVAER